MSTIKTTYIQHPSAISPNIELAADGTVVLPLSGINDLSDVDTSGATSGDVLAFDGSDWVPDSDAVRSTTVSNIVTLTQAAYDAIPSPDAATLYVITD